MKNNKDMSLDAFNDEDKLENNTIFWNYREDKAIIGKFKAWETDGFGQHVVLQVEGEDIHLPNLVALNSKLKSADLKENDLLKIEFKAEVKSQKSGRVYNDFHIWLKRA